MADRHTETQALQRLVEKNVTRLVLLFQEYTIQPELSSPPCFRIQADLYKQDICFKNTY